MSPRCQWLERDAEGRPRCVHGWAVKNGPKWKCRESQMRALRKWRASEKGRVSRQRENASPHARSRKALYELTRVSVS